MNMRQNQNVEILWFLGEDKKHGIGEDTGGTIFCFSFFILSFSSKSLQVAKSPNIYCHKCTLKYMVKCNS